MTMRKWTGAIKLFLTSLLTLKHNLARLSGFRLELSSARQITSGALVVAQRRMLFLPVSGLQSTCPENAWEKWRGPYLHVSFQHCRTNVCSTEIRGSLEVGWKLMVLGANLKRNCSYVHNFSCLDSSLSISSYNTEVQVDLLLGRTADHQMIWQGLQACLPRDSSGATTPQTDMVCITDPFYIFQLQSQLR